jgi:hypothetical protein
MLLIHFHQFIEKIKSSVAWKSKIIIISTALGLAINLFNWGLIYFKFYPLVYLLPPEQSFIPLHYNIYLGIDFFGAWQKIFLFPGIAVFILILNTILAFILFNKKELVSYFLVISSTLCQIFLLISTILAILINV